MNTLYNRSFAEWYSDLFSDTDRIYTEEQCDIILKEGFDVLIEHKPISKELKEIINEDIDNTLSFIGAGIVFYKLLKAIINAIKNRYSLNINRYLSLSKEVDDMYVKVKDLLDNNKDALRKPGLLSFELLDIAMCSPDYPGKHYQIKPDFVLFNPEYYINITDSIISYANKKDEDEKRKYLESEINIFKNDIKSFMNNKHAISSKFTPENIYVKYTRVPIKESIKLIRNWFSNAYISTHYAQDNVKFATQYIQLLQHAYDKQQSKYGRDPICKKYIDAIFGDLVLCEQKSLDFNDKIIICLIESLKNTVKVLEAIYNLLRF